MIRGKYVATVTIDMSVAEDAPNLLPVDEMRANWMTMERALKDVLTEELWGGDKDIQISIKLDTHSCSLGKEEED